MHHQMLEETLAGKPPYRRLFLDSLITERSENLERVFHQPEKHPPNPVVVKDRPWEGWGPYLYGTVMWDDGRLKMWYECVNRDTGKTGNIVCYAESTDGLTWEKPELGIQDYNGSKANNIICPNKMVHNASVIRVPEPISANRRYALFSFGGEHGAHVAFSEDGINWNWHEKPEHSKLFSSSDVINFFYDPMHSRYTVTYKTGSRHGRSVGVAWSEDGIHWVKPVDTAVFAADELDPDDTQVYGMPVFPYQGIYVGLPWIYHARIMKYGKYYVKRLYETQEGSPRTVDVQLSWSWDLINWNRTPKREPFHPLGEPAALDSLMIYTARAPVIVDDKLCFYYGGFDKVHDDLDDVHGGIFLTTLRMDGFCSMSAGADAGWLISRRERFTSSKVTINARTAPGGYVAAELVDRWDNPIPGFTRADCKPFEGDSTSHVFEWKGKSFPSDLERKDKKIRFFLENANLYSYLPDGLIEDEPLEEYEK